MRTGRSLFTMRITTTGKELLELLADRRGISQTSVVEQLIRDEAIRHGVTVATPEPTVNRATSEDGVPANE